MRGTATIVDRVVGHLGAALDALVEAVRALRDSSGKSGARITLGRAGERLAARHLQRRGFRIGERNFRAAAAEIDLIAMDGQTLVFVEVKTRSTTIVGAPADAVDRRKREHLRRAARAFAARHRAKKIRFDVFAITGSGRARRLEQIRDAF